MKRLCVLLLAFGLTACNGDKHQEEVILPLNEVQKDRLSEFSDELSAVNQGLDTISGSTLNYRSFLRDAFTTNETDSTSLRNQKQSYYKNSINAIMDSGRCDLVTYSTEVTTTSTIPSVISKLEVVDKKGAHKNCPLRYENKIKTDGQTVGDAVNLNISSKESFEIAKDNEFFFFYNELGVVGYETNTSAQVSVRGVADALNIDVTAQGSSMFKVKTNFDGPTSASYGLSLNSQLAESSSKLNMTVTIRYNFPSFTAIGVMSTKMNVKEYESVEASAQFSVNGVSVSEKEFKRLFSEDVLGDVLDQVEGQTGSLF